MSKTRQTSLTSTECQRLGELENTIKEGLQTFVEVGLALAEIRDSRLYRLTHGTFENYCREKWGMSKSYVYYKINAATTVASLSTIVDKPENEHQARQLSKAKPEERNEVWEHALDLAHEEGSENVASRHLKKALNAALRTTKKKRKPEPRTPRRPAHWPSLDDQPSEVAYALKVAFYNLDQLSTAQYDAAWSLCEQYHTQRPTRKE